MSSNCSFAPGGSATWRRRGSFHPGRSRHLSAFLPPDDSSLDAAYEGKIKSPPEDTRKAARGMGAFGEGMAVLAAAGSPDVPPMADFPERDRVLWDLEAESFGANLDDVNQFFLDTVHGDLRNDAVAHEGSIFFAYAGRGTRSGTAWPLS